MTRNQAEMPRSDQSARARTGTSALRLLCGFAVLVLIAGGCQTYSPGEDADDLRAGPFSKGKNSDLHRAAPVGDRPIQISITNLHGWVKLRHTDDEDALVTVENIDGFHAGVVRFSDEGQGAYRLEVLDAADAAKDAKPETPENRADKGVDRLGYRLPRVDVIARIPRNTYVNVVACSVLEVEADADITARCGTAARLHSGHGIARIESPVVDAQSCAYEVIASVSGQARFSNTIGDKRVTGAGNVNITGGSGALNIEVRGRVYVEAPIVGGYARADVAGRSGATSGAGSEEFPIELIGPSAPNANDRRNDREPVSTASRISASEVEVRMPDTCALEVFVNVANGPALFHLPSGNRRVVPHAMSQSSGHFSVGAPKGELRIDAAMRGEVIVTSERPSER